MVLRLLVVTVTLAASLVLPATTARAESCAPAPPTTPTAGPVALPGRQETGVRWTRISRTVEYGGTAILEGQVVTDDGALPDAEVHLFARPTGESAWTQVTSTTSDPDTGVFVFDCVSPRHNTDYRATYSGDLRHGGSQATRRVGVTRQVPDLMRQTRPSRLVYSGSVAPRYRGRVILQHRSARGRWSRVDVDRTGRRSTWRFVLEDPRRGWYRAVVPGDGRFVTSPSDHVWRVRAG